ncbi:MAG: hypothetical protein HQ567_13585 [Candidatus Nealsonbacteria bacterium]|nr:hypothetical protein [Candidatus Nealsonbacteria bacterium]
MIKHAAILLCLACLASVGVNSNSHAEPPGNPVDLEARFLDPPDEARPSAYWLWLGGHVNRAHVERELKAFHDVGVRGLCIFDMGARGAAEGMPPAGPAFLSERSVEDIAHAVRIAGRLGIDVQLSVASSWDMGGAWVEPRHASMGLFQSETTIEGPASVDQVLPLPPLPAKAPRRADGKPVFCKDVAVLAIPAERRMPGYDFVFKLNPPGLQTLDYAVLHNAPSDDAKQYGDLHLFTKDFSVAVSSTTPTDDAFREVLRASLKPAAGPQRFEMDVAPVDARYVRLRILNGHNARFDRVQLGEFQLFNGEGVNVVGSHAADRSRDGAELLGYPPALGRDKVWTAGNLHDGSTVGAGGCWCSAGPPPLWIEDPAKIVDLTGRVDADGRLQWNAPAGKWVVVRYVCTNTGERLKVPSPNSDGLATDHFSREATRTCLNYVIDRLRSKLGNLDETALKQLYLASYEVRGAMWTPDMLEQFRRYRSYDMTRYLPVLSGNVVRDDDVTQRFVYDYRKTLGDLLVDAYYRAAVETAHAAGLGIESESGGPGPPIHQVPVDALKALGAIDEVRGEFWPHRPEADRLWVVKETACAAHTYGKRRVHTEAFTSMYHWEDGPFELKPSADRAFCEGMNHVVWHTGAHQPPESGRPGWVYGAGTHLNTNLVWWKQCKPFLDYLARCSFLLQQGHFVADVCYYYGDQGFNFVPPKHVDPSLGYGRDYDVANAEVVLNRMSVRDGRITLPDGMQYELLVLPEREDINVAVLRKLEELVDAGATVVGPKPTRSGGLTDHPARDREVKQLADKLWGDCDGKRVVEHQYGRGKIVWGRTLQEILLQRGMGPDFRFVGERADADLDFIHRRTAEADIYFVRNKKLRRESVDAHFRVSGKAPEFWLPDSGEIVPHPAYEPTAGGVRVGLRFAEAGSLFVVFRKLAKRHGPTAGVAPDKAPAAVQLAGPWTVRFPDGWGAPDRVTWTTLKSWTDDERQGIRYFSGTARYETEFEIPGPWLQGGNKLLLDLGRLWAVGEVRLNGQPLGIVWKPPYRLELGKAARPGRNRLEVEVANTWSNRLVGDARSPQDERYCRTNITGSGTPRKPWKDVPLHESGLLGPVRLIRAVERTIPHTSSKRKRVDHL